MIKLNEEQLNKLNQFCQELPTKYGVPLLQWFKKIQEEQNPKEQDFTNNPNDPNAGLG